MLFSYEIKKLGEALFRKDIIGEDDPTLERHIKRLSDRATSEQLQEAGELPALLHATGKGFDMLSKPFEPHAK